MDGIETARAFVDARHGARALACYPAAMPATLDAAYAIQDAALTLDGRSVGGWKLGRINAPHDVAYGANRIAGPILSDLIVTADSAVMPVIADGFAAAEAEFLFRLGRDADPGRAAWSVAEARAMVDGVHIGIEIASSPFAEINAHGPAVTASDFGNNFGLLVGPELADWPDRDLDAIWVETRIDGESVGIATTATMLDGPWGALRFLLELLHRRSIPLRAGQWVSTGAVTGVHPVRPGDEVEVRFDEQSMSCRITAAEPIEAGEGEHGRSTHGGA